MVRLLKLAEHFIVHEQAIFTALITTQAAGASWGKACTGTNNESGG